MLKEDIIAFEDISIPFLWGTNCIDEIVHKISNIKADRYVLVTDDKIKDLYGDMLTELLKRNKPVLILSSPTGEKYKNISTLMNYINRSLDWGITRQTLIITLGGGIPGNIGGLLASLLFRGIRLIHIPTTLVAIFDSIISLKQAINGNNAKNLIGTFYIP